MNNFNLEPAIEYVKTLVDKNRCVICDRLNGPIVRYWCGHPACVDCVETTEHCLLCLSPTNGCTNLTDEPFSRRIEHVSLLLTTFQDLFNIDVYKRHRLSEQLKVEKLLFPQCIQAPSKYSNKRKSIKSLENKENSRVSILPGERISNVVKMENTIRYVQQWLTNNESNTKKPISLPRQPFTDLNVNDQSFTNNCSLRTKVNNKVSCKKRTHVKVINTSNKRLLSKKKRKESFKELNSSREDLKENFTEIKFENDESGIVINDDTVVIDNSQSIDKDKLALIAVKEAEKLESCELINFDEFNYKNDMINKSKLTSNFKVIRGKYKIPFYKKNFLYKVCKDCTPGKKLLQNIDESNTLSVIINNNERITTIKFSQSLICNIEIVNKQSVQIQTDKCIDEIVAINTESDTVENVPHKSIFKQEDIKSANIFIDDVENKKLTDKNFGYNCKNEKSGNVVPLKKNKCLIIEESDTESDISELDNTLEVTADVHRAETHDDFGVLSTLEPNACESRRKRSALRGRTPLSTDSSDKENYDPNKMKRQKFGKKYCNKK